MSSQYMIHSWKQSGYKKGFFFHHFPALKFLGMPEERSGNFSREEPLSATSSEDATPTPKPPSTPSPVFSPEIYPRKVRGGEEGKKVLSLPRKGRRETD